MSQLDLFIPIAGDVRARDQQDIMAFPGCSLLKKPRFTKIRFEDSQGSWIEVSPHQDHGMANIWDFDIMLYVVALVRQMKKRGTREAENHQLPRLRLPEIHRPRRQHQGLRSPARLPKAKQASVGSYPRE